MLTQSIQPKIAKVCNYVFYDDLKRASGGFLLEGFSVMGIDMNKTASKLFSHLSFQM